MIAFIIKSTVSLTFLYVFYYILLRNIKTFEFNRFYLLFSLIFSIVVPFINIKIGFNLPLNQNIQDFSSPINGLIIQGNIIDEQSSNIFTITNTGLFLYIIVSMILCIRLIRNLHKITKKIKNSEQVENVSLNIVLAPDKTLPYSFFSHIIVNKDDYENGKIDNELLIHEQTHCEQYHSIDILIIELIKVLMWFNPLIWLFKKEIQLNHEYLADSAVILKHDRKIYQDIILNLVFRNNSTYLASNFNYSLTKKRLIMMTNNNSSINSMARKIAIVPLVLILAVTLTFSQDDIIKDSSVNFDKEWWYPILKKHNLKPQVFNNFEHVFEMGSSNSIDNKIVTIKDAIFIIKTDNNEYTIIKSPLAYHDLNKNIIEGEIGTFETYSSDYSGVKPLSSLVMKNFKYKIKGDKNSFEADKLVLNKERKLASKEQDESFQEKLKGEREAAAKEQDELFQEKLTEERKAAREGKIIIGDK